MPASKQPSPAAQKKPMLHFIQEGMPRIIAEYTLSIIPGAILLFAFFIAAEATVAVFRRDVMAVTFLPVICILPLLSGVVSALVLEKVRNREVSMRAGAIAGGLSAFAGSLASSFVLLALDLAIRLHPFGSGITGILLFFVLAVVVAMDTVLGALGGALTAKFLKDF
ncbi:MAG: hypothetical protein QW275_01645 [Candidatus Anstonellaceae archaeon]